MNLGLPSFRVAVPGTDEWTIAKGVAFGGRFLKSALVVEPSERRS